MRQKLTKDCCWLSTNLSERKQHGQRQRQKSNQETKTAKREGVRVGMQKTRRGYLETEEGKEIKYKLQQMSSDNAYNTASSYSANTLLYPDHLMPFVDKHLAYLVGHPAVEASQYVANIKLLTRLRS